MVSSRRRVTPVSRGDRPDTGKPEKQQNQDAILSFKPM
jgi:hypothetical protein